MVRCRRWQRCIIRCSFRRWLRLWVGSKFAHDNSHNNLKGFRKSGYHACAPHIEEPLDVAFVLGEKRSEVVLVKNGSTMGLRQGQPAHEKKPSMSVQRHPLEHPSDPCINEPKERHDAPVHRPRFQLAELCGCCLRLFFVRASMPLIGARRRATARGGRKRLVRRVQRVQIGNTCCERVCHEQCRHRGLIHALSSAAPKWRGPSPNDTATRI